MAISASTAGAARETDVDAAALLGARGFTPVEAARLVALRRRYQRGEFRRAPIEQKRLEFARWLVEQGRLGDGMHRTTGGQR